MKRWQRRAVSEDHVIVSDSVKARAGCFLWRRINLVRYKGIKSSAFIWKCVLSLGKVISALLPLFPQEFMGFIRT